MNLRRRPWSLVLSAALASASLAAAPASEPATTAGEPTEEAGPRKKAGIDQSLLSDEIAPGQNFYRYANAAWLENTEIPPDKSNYGIFTVLHDRTQEQVRELIERAAEKDVENGSAAQKVGDLYRSVMAVETRNEAGRSPIQPLLDAVEAADSSQQLAETLGWLAHRDVHGPWAPYVSIDARDSDQYTVYLTQAGLTLPDRDYYLQDAPRYVELRKQLKTYAADMLAAAGHPQPDAGAEAIVAIEKALASAHWTKTENRDPVKTYNRHTPEEMVSRMEGFPWQPYAEAAGIGERPQWVVRQPSFLDAAGDLWADRSLDDWKAYLQFRVIDRYASGLSESLERRHFDFHQTAVSGITEQEAAWKRAAGVTGDVLGELVGQLYVEQHFQPSAKERMNAMVDNLKRAFQARLQTRDWMSEGTQKQALEKLALFHTKIGYPDRWKDYSKLAIEPAPLGKNLIAAATFEYQRDLDKLGGPIDRDEWHMTPQTINAYYNPTMNEIVFPAAILQPPFFNMAADDAVNYGAIGAVIGHEISHGFDDKGSKYDGHGNLRQWWTPNDRQEFERRAAGLVEQFNEFQPVDDMNVNGELTLGENIGDLGGLRVAYHAYRLSLGGDEAPVIDGLTGDQRFFLGWAQIWRRLYREQELRRRLIVDPHSPSRYRVNGIVRNLDAWYEAFDVAPEDPLYLKPERRVRIW